MIVTPHFDEEEFACRDGSPYPSEWVLSRLHPLCEALEIIRSRVGSPIIIDSGYRTVAYNRKIGGARLSQHVEGRAADIRVKGWNPYVLKELILNLHRNNHIVIGGFGVYSTFVHVDVRSSGRLAYWEGSRSSN